MATKLEDETEKKKNQTIRRGYRITGNNWPTMLQTTVTVRSEPTVCETMIKLRGRKEGAMYGWQKPRFLSSPKPRPWPRCLSVAEPVFNLSDPGVSLSAKEFTHRAVVGVKDL